MMGGVEIGLGSCKFSDSIPDSYWNFEYFLCQVFSGNQEFLQDNKLNGYAFHAERVYEWAGGFNL